MSRADAFVHAVAAGAVTYDRLFDCSNAGSRTAIAWEHSGWLPDDVPLDVLVHEFLAWQYDLGGMAKKPAWARTEAEPGYGGEIAVGMRFIWGKALGPTFEDVTVTRIDGGYAGTPERRIWVRHTDHRELPEWARLDPNARIVRRRYGTPHDEARFRAEVTPWQG